MKRRLGLSVLLVIGVITAAVTGVVVVTADSEYDISVVGAIDTPSETITLKDSEYEIDGIVAIEQGDVLEVEVTAPDRYDLYLFNTDIDPEAHKRTTDSRIQMGTDDDNLDTSTLEPGTYMLSLEPSDAGRQAVMPVVVQGHDISLDYPSSVEANSEVTFDATVEPIDGSDQPDEVELVIWDGDSATDITLEQTDGTKYSATTLMNDFKIGTYDVYGAVISDESVEDYDTASAVTDGHELTVTESDDDDEKDDESDGNGDENDDGIAGDNDKREGNETGEKNNDIVSDENGDETDEADGSADDDKTDRDESSANGEDNDESDSDVIEPNETDANETDTNDSTADDDIGMPTGVLAAIAVAALLSVAIVQARR